MSAITPVARFTSESSYGTVATDLPGPAFWVARFDMDEGAAFGDHDHPEHQLVWAPYGQLLTTIGSQRWVLGAGRALWVPGGVTHTVTAYRPSELVSLYSWPDETPRTWPEPTVLEVSPLVRELLLHLARTDLDEEGARWAALTLFDALAPSTMPVVELPRPTGVMAGRVAEAILDDPADAHSQREWAARLHVSTKTLQRSFVTETGMTFSAWRTRARLHIALPMLADGMPVAAVAARVGYRSVPGFVAAFRAQFGGSPAALFAAR